MSPRPIDRSPDLKRLRDEGYNVEVRAGHLLVKDVPYVNERREVKRGVLVSVLDLQADGTTLRPSTHVAMFEGEHPCHRDGRRITEMVIGSERKQLVQDVWIDHTLSSRPARGHYDDYYEKMSTYAAILAGPACAIDPEATARTFPVFVEEPDDSVFQYTDTASSRAGITAVSQKLEGQTIGIVGLGGTGAYVLDQVAKTPVRAIHLFDGDTFSPHNAFRAPGAASVDELKAAPTKVAYFHGIYSRMHRYIVPHEVFIDASNAEALDGMDFVFLCTEAGDAKRAAVERLEARGIPFVDVGMGLYVKDSSLYGVLRVTASTPTTRARFPDRTRISFAGADGDDAYTSNIQVADLNALNAALAVVRWKKLCGFYGDFDREHFSTYTVDGNVMTNDDRT